MACLDSCCLAQSRHLLLTAELDQLWIRLVPLLPLTPTSTTRTTCGTLGWILCHVQINVLWIHILMRLPWGELHALADEEDVRKHHCCHNGTRMAPLKKTVRDDILHHINGMASGKWCKTQTERPRFRSICGIVRSLASLLHQRGDRTNYAGQCQSGTVLCIRLPSMKDCEEMVLHVLKLLKSVLLFRRLRGRPPFAQSLSSHLWLTVTLFVVLWSFSNVSKVSHRRQQVSR